MLQKIKSKYASSLMLILGLISCNHGPIPESEARELAYSALQEYSTQESINIGEFGEPKEVSYNKEVEVWEIYYESKTKPKHRINILVDDFRNVETHSSIDKEEASSSDGG